ncbi:MAG TPA: hypothetical protein VFW75_09805 [Acetobacteraceae bacterium]|nr:hypothetical protein [Acetobacteraceae bacterium]
MRRALGLDGERQQQRSPPPQPSMDRGALQARPKRRFVTDGDVPVVHGRLQRRDDIAPQAAPATNRAETAELAARAEREAREKAERSLLDAQATIHDLQTRLGHAQLAATEAQHAIEAERTVAAALRAALDAAEAQAAEATAAQTAAERRLDTALAALATEREARQSTERSLRRAIDVQPVTPAIRATAAAAKPPKRPVGRPKKAAVLAEEPVPVKWWLKPRTKRRQA